MYQTCNARTSCVIAYLSILSMDKMEKFYCLALIELFLGFLRDVAVPGFTPGSSLCSTRTRVSVGVLGFLKIEAFAVMY